MLGNDGEPLKREYVSGESGQDLESSETVRGYETAKGKYITVTDEELERLAPEKSRDIDLRLFTPRNEISPLYFNKAYFLTPAGKSAKAYLLLAATMERTGRAGVATFVMSGKEHLVAIFADHGILRAETLRFHDEIRRPEDIGLPKKKKAPPKRIVQSFQSAIAKLTKKTLGLSEMRDEYADAMLKLIEKKQARHKDIVESEAPQKRPAKVVDLMEVLKQSLSQSRKSKRAA